MKKSQPYSERNVLTSIYTIKDPDQFTDEELLFYFMKDGKTMGIYAKMKFTIEIHRRNLHNTFYKLCLIFKKNIYEPIGVE